MDLGRVIKEERSKSGISRREFARMVGMSATTLSKIENGGKFPTIGVIKKISVVFGTSPAVLFILSMEVGVEVDEKKRGVFEFLKSFIVIMFNSFYN